MGGVGALGVLGVLEALRALEVLEAWCKHLPFYFIHLYANRFVRSKGQRVLDWLLRRPKVCSA